MSEFLSDIEIARSARMRPIEEIGARLGLAPEALLPYGRHIAKIDVPNVAGLEERPQGKLVLVTAISPTPAGEGKTTTTVGLGDGLTRIGQRAAICLREPSLGPCFGMKGGAAGGGYAQVVPMEQINLHFTGDFHAITSAHNLLSALIDNHIYWGNKLDLDLRRVSWRRVMDMNDRSLRQMVTGLGSVGNGFARESGFDITVASEVMAILCLARDLDDLKERLSRIVIGETRERRLVAAEQIEAAGAMTVLLKDALLPNLVQTLEGTPAMVHGGPFANIAHGCNTLTATRTALRLADYVVTEAGFGADLGAEKFIDIKCRQGGLRPDLSVVVATLRALKHHGGVGRDGYGKPDLGAIERGFVNLERHVLNLRKFGLRSIVAINHFHTDTAEELALLRDLCRDRLGVEAVVCRHWADGSAGTEELAARVVALCEQEHDTEARFLYPDDMPLWDKLRTIAREIYGATEVAAQKSVRDRFRELEANGYGNLPVCVAKTQYSFSTDPTLLGAPSGHILPVREVRLSAGAGFVVAVCGDIMTMPGLPRSPAAAHIDVDQAGLVQGLS